MVDLKWPGQEAKGLMNLEQVRVLCSAIRSEVFFSIGVDDPLSVNEVAKMLGRSAPAVRYNVKALVDAGLLIVAEKRKRYARTESAYVHKYIEIFTLPPPQGPEYMRAMHEHFAAILRSMERANRVALAVVNEDPEFAKKMAFRTYYLRLRPEPMAKLREDLNTLVSKYDPLATPDGVRVQVVTFMSPVVAEGNRHLRELTGTTLEVEDE